jgi:XTP/dITP diphosphohydrolase
MRALLADLRVELLTPRDLSLDIQVEEKGSTYGENAALKARAFTQHTGLISLADDSGLEVDALGGAPGLYSARYAPQLDASDADRRIYLLEQLRDQPRPWTARFRCTLAIATPGGGMHLTEGVCPGEILPKERGQGGFGYDPVFWIPGLGCTMAELSMQTKNRISHRARAVRAAIPLLEELI